MSFLHGLWILVMLHENKWFQLLFNEYEFLVLGTQGSAFKVVLQVFF